MRAGRRTAVPLRVVAGIALVLLGTQFVGEAHGLVASSGPGGQLQLSTDDGGAPMFAASNLTPGRQLARCIRVFHEGTLDPEELRLTGSATGTLARHLDLVVESGRGGRFGQCDGFAGRTRYRGTLQAFAATHGKHTEGLAVPTAAESATTFRFTLTVRPDPRAEGTSNRAAFVWQAEGADVSVPVVAPPADDDPPPALSPPAPALDDADPTLSPADPEPSRPLPESGPSTVPDGLPALAPDPPAAPAAAVPVPGGEGEAERGEPRGSTAGGRRGDTTLSPREGRAAIERAAATLAAGEGSAADDGTEILGWGARLRKLLADAATIIAVVAESATFPLLLLLLMVLFLVLQDRIDRNDPKLADAPVRAEPDLVFWPPPTLEGPSR